MGDEYMTDLWHSLEPWQQTLAWTCGSLFVVLLALSLFAALFADGDSK